MTPEQFVAELDGRVAERLSQIGTAAAGAEPKAGLAVADLLVLALKKELEASDIAALWMGKERDVDVKLALARQCGDEAKHYRLIEDRLRELGRDPSRIDPLEGGPTPMFRFLSELPTTVERVAAGQFTREALAQTHNRVFIEWCEANGDPSTAKLYRDIVQPDEGHHHELGRKLLLRLAVADADQAAARAAAQRTLDIADEIQEMVRMKKGIARAPGC